MFDPLRKKNRIISIVSLVLAVATYFYVTDIMKASRQRPIDSTYKLLKFTAKSLPVKVRFASNPPAGYRLIQEKVSVRPDRIMVIGPEALLEENATAQTAILDISQSTRKIVKGIPIVSVSGIPLVGEPYGVEVVVPIEEIEVNR